MINGGITMEDREYRRHRCLWPILWHLGHGILSRLFAYEYDELVLDGPCLMICNHVTNWDPLLTALSLRRHHAYFVASEHIFRNGLLSRLLVWFLGPIARKKGGSSASAVMDCMRHLAAGHSVVLYAEGDCTWDGVTHRAFPATAKLAKRCGASLVTYRLEGGYFTWPRWGKSLRRGRMRGHVVNIYSPEKLKEMSVDEINEAIYRDTLEDAWERQRKDPVVYRTKKPARSLETSLYLCPECGKIGTLRTNDREIFCSCGLRRTVTYDGQFLPAEPMKTVADWDAWQAKSLAERSFPEGEVLFSDENVFFSGADGSQKPVKGQICQYADHLEIAGMSFEENKITDMAMVKNWILLFTYERNYYEVRSHSGINLRKCLAFRQTHGTSKGE